MKRANGTGSVYKLPGKRRRPWTAVKGGQYVGYYGTKKEAQEALERLAGQSVPRLFNYTFAQVYEAWSTQHFPDIVKSAQAQYAGSFNVFAELHDRKFRDLRTNDFQTILDRHAGQAKSTVNKHKHLLSQMSKWAIENELITTNFASFCKARGREAEPHQPLTLDEIKRIEADGSETSRIVLMLLATGMRIGELFTLRLEDYYGTYCIGGEKTEAGRGRIIPIRTEGRQHFEYFYRQAVEADGELIIDGYAGNRRPSTFRRRDYAAMLDRCGIDRSKTPHSTRATYGTRAATEEQMAPAVLQKVLGHAQFDTTQKYYNRPDAAALVKAVEKAAKGG